MAKLLITILLGPFGIHKFVEKKYILGAIYFFTFGLFGIGWIIDIVIAVIDLNKKSNTITKNMHNIESNQEYTSNPIFYIHSSKDTEKNIQQLKSRFIVFDTETTGLNSKTDRIISIAAILFVDGNEVDNYYSLINPKCHIPASSTKINGITDQMVADAPTEEIVCQQFKDFIGDSISGKTLMVAYNSSFDAKFLKEAMERTGIGGNLRHFDVLNLAKKRIDNLSNYKLATVAKHLNINIENAHNALRDSEMCAEILLKLI